MTNKPHDIDKIRTHHERVEEAKRLIATTFAWQTVSRADRDAFVKWLLLEDLCALFQNRAAAAATRAQHAAKRGAGEDAARYRELYTIYLSAKDVAYRLLFAGRFSRVSQAVPEKDLLKALSGHAGDLRALGVRTLERLSAHSDIEGPDRDVSSLPIDAPFVDMARQQMTLQNNIATALAALTPDFDDSSDDD